MHRSTLRTRSDLRSMVEDAQQLFREAAASTGEKAEDLRDKGLELLDSAVSKAQDVQAAAIEAGKEIAATTDDYVQENPWRAIAISAGIGLLVGLVISRK
ncbi:Membrane-anchored ribosome-binding protein, inhibits growth in stationary phase, ElaB/YqjD/DUF883 family [Collimonas sp. OK242]|jgi:ElaB/YqjD/DUF883 family membrane-anchored ribosome-binding protein|uniref:DUF883 family protein n=1 Tax=Collimonas sp. OK242 TaxID=1798195 RepID=UPI00089B5BF1|nr:DUF883 family protein [Collimonas sp. OK242]SDX83985.1 Membrane-anchored ribosome-binding protein, inhibits growth in stationary phase, ElaB/YqjD/DUF883 family [Collimonas sp. OK242]